MIGDLYIQFIYQPFLNILVLIYKGLDFLVDNPDMGIALIIFTVILRIILYPLTKKNEQSEEERMRLMQEYENIKISYKGQPIREKKAIKDLIKGNKNTAIFEMINLTIQVVIALMLFRIFRTGLSGADFNLLYGFVPEIKEPFNLVFLNNIDLTRPNMLMNALNSIAIFIAEAQSLSLSPFPASRSERIMFQLILPIAAFIFFGYMPAGKKLFVIATLSISIIIMGFRMLKFTFNKNKKRLYIYH